ncbi:MAG: redoxin domain-containing protein [Micromonosporaceae bacterium]|nr:redoxin domain-containing protein [Micromonosporaceae bacterium]
MIRMTRVRAPELRGRGWLNTGGRSYSITDFRGRIVLLDFWTFCCINCLHVLDELRPLEERYHDVLDVIGVHSPKFEHERDPAALAAAVQRYGVTHPVLDDPDLRTWDQYAAKAWPTLCVVDPEGYVVASMAGEGHADGLARLIEELVREHTARGTLRRGDGSYVPAPEPGTDLRFPAKAIVGPAGELLVADAAHHSIAVLDGLEIVARRIGSGRRGRADGPAETAEFSEPNGLCRLPADVAATVGYDLVVADTVNHLLRGVRLDTGEVSTVAGTGRPWRGTVDFDAHPALDVDLSSPWDVVWYDGRVIVAMAGIHQLWWFDPVRSTAGVYAGTTVEALRDGPLEQVFMAQPSGLSVSADGSTLWIADSESSALRYVRDGQMGTAIGQGLFDFGHMDGKGGEALLQHPLGVAALADGTVLIADTYNGAVRRYDPATDLVSTVATGLAEPSGITVLPDGGLVVVESAAHRLVPLSLTEGLTAEPVRLRTERPPTLLAPGEVSLRVVFTPAPGQKLDETYGPSTRLEVSASPPELLVSGAGVGTELERTLVLSSTVERGVLQVVARAATCDDDGEHAACYLTRQDWGVPIIVTPDGARRLPLILRGLDDQ